MEPKLRLKGYRGDWMSSKIGQIATFSKGSGYSKSDLCKNGNPIVLYGRMYTRYQSIIDDVDTFVVPKQNSVYSNGGEVIIPGSGESPEDISLAATIKNSGVILGGDLNILKFDENINNPAFMAMAITYSPTRAQLSNYAQGKTVVHLRNSEIAKGSICYPKINEQKDIVNYVSSIDILISSLTSRLAALNQIKAASLQAMFPQEGETMPKVRFKGFEDSWKKESLGNLFSERIESNVDGEMLSVTMNSGIIKAADNGRFDNSNSDKSKYKVVKVGDIAYNSMRMWQGASGCSQYEGIVSPAYTVVVPNENVDSTFFAFLFKTTPMIHLFRLHSQGLTKDTWNLKYPAFSLIEVLYPESKQEQQKIADYFTSLDKQIYLHTKRLEKIKQIKSACLDKMFV